MSRLKNPVTAQDHYRGSLMAPVVLLEYGDFRCPYCAAAYPMLERLIEEFPYDLCFVYRHFPITSSHPLAALASLSAEAAAKQGRFWEMHHLLFEDFETFGEESPLLMAEQLGLDTEQFKSDMFGDQLVTRVQEDFSGGVRSGVNGTPTLFLNDFRYDGKRSYYDIRNAIQSLAAEGNDVQFFY